ncbi:hypothetical protein [Halopenitus persicus]|uniref:hypothetical protein n=1 Tax=Halopenitus persicus TaxID=1048396 RepID=UPI000BBAD550|nr:hypothetical protein [Halopenitus persicus]
MLHTFLKRLPTSDGKLLDQIAGITGLGWTASVLGYLATVLGYGNVLVTRLAVDPKSFLYVGASLFVATFGLDRLRRRITNGEQ